MFITRTIGGAVLLLVVFSTLVIGEELTGVAGSYMYAFCNGAV